MKFLSKLTLFFSLMNFSSLTLAQYCIVQTDANQRVVKLVSPQGKTYQDMAAAENALTHYQNKLQKEEGLDPAFVKIQTSAQALATLAAQSSGGKGKANQQGSRPKASKKHRKKNGKKEQSHKDRRKQMKRGKFSGKAGGKRRSSRNKK